MLTTILVILLLGAFGIIAFNWLTNRNFSVHLKELSSLAQEITKGKYPEIRKQSATTEVALLSNRFADMVNALRKKNEEITRAHSELQKSAVTDALTGVFNRRAFEQRLDKIVKNAQYGTKTHAVCFIDLDQFKIVNDYCGRIAGDDLLRQLTTLLNSRVRGADVLARIGGDEFGLVLYDVSPDVANHIANEILLLIQGFQFPWKDKIYEIGASIGVVLIDANTESSTEVMTQADIACYSAKNEGRNCVYFFREDGENTSSYKEEINWIKELKAAISENRFQLWGQRIFSNSDDEKSLFIEVLIRLTMKDGSLIPPGAFLPAAERFNIMPQIDNWVIESVFSYLAKFNDDQRNIRLFINLSGLSLTKPDTLEFIQKKLKEYRVPPSRICFEITETCAIHNLSNAIHLVNELKQLGCKFALDDFGAGLCSFKYLKHLDTDYIKIDGSYVVNMLNNIEDEGMVESINNIAHLTGKETIAEFVENEKTLIKLKKIGINYSQGFWTAKPKPLDENLQTLAENFSKCSA